MQPLKIVAIALLVWLPSTIGAQTLVKDANALVQAIKTIENRIENNTPDSLIRDASATILAILYNYEAPMGQDSVVNFNWEKFLSAYSNNPMLGELAVKEDFALAPDSLSVGFNQLVWQKLEVIQSGPRQKMIDLLHAETTIKPSDYLSISKTLHEYTIPPIQNGKALQISAHGSNSNVSYNLVDAQAVVRGLFNFIIGRAQEEVVINFLEKLLNEDTPKLKELFPTVVERFDDIDFTYSNSFLERVRQAFYEDLQLLSVRLPELLLHPDYFHVLQEDPVVYNLLVVYSMIGMAQNDLPIDEILPVAHRFIYGRYADANKKINLHLAGKSFDKTEYQTLTEHTKMLVDSLRSIYRNLGNAQLNLDLFVDSLELTYNTTDSLVEAFYLKAPYDLEILLGSGSETEFDLSLLPFMLKGKLDSAYVLTYNSVESYDKLFGIERNPKLWRAAGLDLARDLNGNWYTDYTLDEIMRNWHRDLTAYNEAVEAWHLKIDTVSRLQAEWDKIELKRKNLRDTILATKAYWQNLGYLPHTMTYDQGLQFDLLAAIIKDFSVINELAVLFEDDDLSEDTGDPQGLDETELDEDLSDFGLEDLDAILEDDTLEIDIETDTIGLESDTLDLPTEEFDPAGLSSTSGPEPPASRFPELQIDTLENLRLKRQRLMEIERRLFELNDTLSTRNPAARNGSPVVSYMFNQFSTVPFANILNQIDLFAYNLIDLRILLDTIDNKYGGSEAKAKRNAEPVLQFTEVLTYLMYGLRTDDLKNKWISRETLDTILNDPRQEQAFLGLLYQRMSNIKDLGRFSPEGLAQFLQVTIADISTLPKKKVGKPETADSLAFYRKLSFGVNLFNRLLELPLTVDPDERPDAQDYFKPIVQQKRGKAMGLDKLPEITNQVTDFIYFLNVKDHRHAVSSGIRLFTKLTTVAGQRKGENCDPAIKFMKDYGGFIADLIDADSASQVKDIINSIADPPGSSRIKRRKQMTVGLNAYVGASLGMESWNGVESVDANFFDVSPTIPIGIAFSWLGKKKYPGKNPGSHSLFLSLLDLGELLTLRDVNVEEYENLFAFKNVFKPSFQYHWNLQKSPFYLGIGGQLGSQYFNLNGVEQNVNSNKIFVSFGIDVPIKTFYQK